jgi:predicted nucleic acid-binding protein
VIVLDASALIDVAPAQRNVERTLDQIDADDVTAPGHQPAEVLSALMRMVTTDRRLAGAHAPCEVRVPPSGPIPPPREG